MAEGCAYAHMVTVKTNDVNKLSEEIESMKTEMDKLKNTVNALSEMRMEEKLINDAMEFLQKYICNLKFENKSIAEKIRLLEDESEDTDSEDSSDEEFTESNKRKEKHWNECDE